MLGLTGNGCWGHTFWLETFASSSCRSCLVATVAIFRGRVVITWSWSLSTPLFQKGRRRPCHCWHNVIAVRHCRDIILPTFSKRPKSSLLHFFKMVDVVASSNFQNGRRCCCYCWHDVIDDVSSYRCHRYCRDVIHSKWPPSSLSFGRDFICLTPYYSFHHDIGRAEMPSDRPRTALACSGDLSESIETNSPRIQLTSRFGPSQGIRLVWLLPSSSIPQSIACSEFRQVIPILVPLAWWTFLSRLKRYIPESRRDPILVLSGEDVISLIWCRQVNSALVLLIPIVSLTPLRRFLLKIAKRQISVHSGEVS